MTAARDDLRQRLAALAQRLNTAGRPALGTTPAEAVYQEAPVTLYRYRESGRSTPPLLIVYALVNRPYVVDLEPDRSLVRGLLDRGRDLFLLDWGYPSAADRFLTLEDYIGGYLDRAVAEVRRLTGAPRVDLLGICQGGVFSLIYSALNPHRVGRLVTMVTPVDFHTPDNRLARLVREMDVDRLVDLWGNIPGALINHMFRSLSPYRQGRAKYLALMDVADPLALERFLRMEHWVLDGPDQAGEAFRQFARGLFLENRLVRGGLRIGRRPVDLAHIDRPVLNIYAKQDELVPPASSLALGGLLKTPDYTAQGFDGGHIGIYVGRRSSRLLPPAISDWLDHLDRRPV